MIIRIRIAFFVALGIGLVSAASAQIFPGDGVPNEVYAASFVWKDRSQSHVMQGREIEAPPWSFACITDHGPAPCGAHVWAYGDAN
jgi:hypothetical protein